MQRQRVLLEGIDEALASLDKALRRHSQSYDYKFYQFVTRRKTKKSKKHSASSSSNV